MGWTPSDKEIEAVSALAGPKRYDYWIKKVADQKEIWSLWEDRGWALTGDSTRREMVPVWPHARYAALCATGAWSGYQPRVIPSDVWLERWIPGMERDNRLIAVFPTARDKSAPVVEPRRLERD